MGIDADFRYQIPQDADFPDDITAERDPDETRVYTHPGILSEIENELKAALDGQDQYREQCRILSAENRELKILLARLDANYADPIATRKNHTAEQPWPDLLKSEPFPGQDDPVSTQQDVVVTKYRSGIEECDSADTRQSSECDHLWFPYHGADVLGSCSKCSRCGKVSHARV